MYKSELNASPTCSQLMRGDIESYVADAGRFRLWVLVYMV